MESNLDLDWYLFEAPGFWCVVQEKNVLQARTPIKKEDKCTFFYLGKQYEGTVLEKEKDHVQLNSMLTKLKNNKKLQSKQSADSEPETLLGKRKISPVNFYGKSADTSTAGGKKSRTEKGAPKAPKMSEEDRRKQRIRTLNRQESQKRSNAILQLKVSETAPPKEKDPSWLPAGQDEELYEEDNDTELSENFDIDEPKELTQQTKKHRTTLVKQITNSTKVTAVNKKSDEDEIAKLRRENELLQIRLKMLSEPLNQAPKHVSVVMNNNSKSKETLNDRCSKEDNDQSTINETTDSETFDDDFNNSTSSKQSAKRKDDNTENN